MKNVSVQAKSICGAKTRSGGECQKPPMPNGRCRLHGGACPAGPAHPNYKTGRYSRYAHRLSADQQDDFQAALTAPDPLSLAEEIGLARVLLLEALSPGPDLYAVRRCLHQAELALENALTEEERVDARYVRDGIASGEEWDAEIKPAELRAEELVKRALDLVREGYEVLTGQEVRPTDHDKVQKYMGSLKNLVDTSARVMDIRANSFTRLQSQALIGRIVELISGNVKDPQDRKRLLTAFMHLEGEVAPAGRTPSGQIAGKAGS